MNTRNRMMPYPVLGNDDAVFPQLESDSVEMSFELIDEKEIQVHVELCQRNQDITKLINQGKAEYLCELYCRDTYLREKYTSQSPVFNFVVRRDSVAGNVEFDFYVVLKEDLLYTNIGFHEDYKGISFDLEKGNILVMFRSRSYNVDVKNYKIYAVGSFLKIMKAKVQDISLDMEQNDAIYILLPERMYQQYIDNIKVNHDFDEIVIASLLNYYLAKAISNYNDEEHKDKNWADALKMRLKAINEKEGKNFRLGKEDAFELSNRILEKPFDRLFTSLVLLNERAQSQSINQKEE